MQLLTTYFLLYKVNNNYKILYSVKTKVLQISSKILLCHLRKEIGNTICYA